VTAPRDDELLVRVHACGICRTDPTMRAIFFFERQVRSVTANTRADGEALLAEAAAIGVRLATTTFALTDANRALSALERGAFAGSGVLVS